MKYYFKFSIKEMLKNKLITIGSFTSMVVGLLGVFLIYVWVDNERSTDRFHSNVDKIYMTVSQQSLMDGKEPINGAGVFRLDYSEFPQVQARTSTYLYSEDRMKLKKGEEEFRGRGLVADSTFFQIFDFELLKGDSEVILNNPKNLLLTESMAKKIFGDQNPIGETLYMESDRKGYYEVAGIMKDIPSNSSIHFDYLIPSHSNPWWGIISEEFILVTDDFNKAVFDEAIKYRGRVHEQFKESILSTLAFSGVYFDTPVSSNLFIKFGDRDEVNTLLLVALVVLLVSIFNFANLQTTLAYTQVKTRGIKQVHGASGFTFFMEVLVSRFIYLIIGFGLIYLLFQLVKPSYLNFLEITQNFSTTGLLFNIGIAITGFLAVAQVFTLLQTPKIVSRQALIGSLRTTKGGVIGKVLTTVQYVFAITLIIVTAVVFKQFNYMQHKDLGFESESVVSIKFFEELPFDPDEDQEESLEKRKKMVSDYKLVKSELLKIPGVALYSQGSLPIDGSAFPMSWKLGRSNYDYTEVNIMSLEPAYAGLLDLKLTHGRFFSDSLDRSRQNKVVINQAAMDYWGLDEIDGAKVASSSWGGEEKPWEVIGVVEDFHYEHLSKKVKPLVMVYFNDIEENFLVRLSAERFKTALKGIESLFNKVNSQRLFEYKLLETKLAEQYKREEKLSQIFILFTLMGLVISSIGLFTFSLYETRKRIKEVGIRKVVGASVAQVTGLLSISFIKWVMLAFVIAGPLSYMLMKDWLSNFANQTELSWWLFLGAGLVTLLMALFTVIGQTYLAAKRNPIDSLRYE